MNEANNQQNKNQQQPANNKTNGLALLLFAMVIVTASPMDSIPTLTYAGLVVGLIGLVLVLVSSSK